MLTTAVDSRIIPSIFDKVSVIMYRLFISYAYLFVKVAIAAWTFIEDKPVIMLEIFICFIIVELLLSRDIMPMLSSLIIIATCIFSQYGTYIDDYIAVMPYAIAAMIAILVRFIIYRTHFTSGKILYPTIAVAIAILLGGIGLYPAKAYLQPILLYYYIGLSIGAILTYLGLRNYIYNDSVYKPMVALTHLAVSLCLLGFIMIFQHVLPYLIEAKPWAVQWSNNLSTILIFSMPFCFYRAIRGRFSFIYLIIGVLAFIAILLTLSRGGILFGTLTFCASGLYALIYSRKFSRASIIILAGVCLGIVIFLLSKKAFLDFLHECMQISPNEARVKMYALAVDNFIKHPIFGTGVFFKGDFYSPAKGAMYWYHSTPFQIIGMTGIVGIIAYSYQYFVRFKTLLNRKSLFNYACFISFLMFELMAFVNPGDYVPIPFMVMLFMLFCICEITVDDKPDKYEVLKIGATKEDTDRLFRV